MKKEELRKLMKENFDEITQDGYARSWRAGESSHPCEDGNLYFKPKQKFPLVFEDKHKKIEVDRDGNLDIYCLFQGDSIYFNSSKQVLFDAVDKAKELSKK